MSMLSTTPFIRGVDEIGPYQILEDLGPAPFGTAYLAVDSRSDRRVFLKVIPSSRPGFEQEETPWDVLLRETRTLARIYHRGIPPLVEIAEHEGALLVSFAAVRGDTLHDLMVQGKRPNRNLLVDWGCQLLDILAEAHAEGILHRHVSEDQIVIDLEGRLILMGFGLTQIHFDPLAAFPPERSLGEPLSRQSDLYAVGLLLRRLAFASGLKAGRGGGSPQRDPLLKVLARATVADPEARFRDAREMAEALRQAGRAGSPLLAPRPVPQGSRSTEATPARPQPIARLTARPEAAAETEEHQDRRLALLLVAAALVLLLIVIAAGWLLVGGRKNVRPVFPPVAHGPMEEPAAAPTSSSPPP
jgi:serine/threonine protein kinase